MGLPVTCIVGIQHPGGVTIGADTAGTDGWSITSRADTKLFRNGPYLFGFCGSFRMGQLLHYSLVPPKPPRIDLERHMSTVFVDAVRECLIEGGYAQRKNEVESGGTFLVAVAGQLFCIQNDYQVARQRMGFDAIGSGEEVALGSLHTTAQYDIDPRSRVLMALQAAADLTTFVMAPFTVKTAKP
jgi:ATP-dependent protease HslVU (ClpYQ) peptidase subunit